MRDHRSEFVRTLSVSPPSDSMWTLADVAWDEEASRAEQIPARARVVPCLPGYYRVRPIMHVALAVALAPLMDPMNRVWCTPLCCAETTVRSMVLQVLRSQLRRMFEQTWWVTAADVVKAWDPKGASSLQEEDFLNHVRACFTGDAARQVWDEEVCEIARRTFHMLALAGKEQPSKEVPQVAAGTAPVEATVLEVSLSQLEAWLSMPSAAGLQQQSPPLKDDLQVLSATSSLASADRLRASSRPA